MPVAVALGLDTPVAVALGLDTPVAVALGLDTPMETKIHTCSVRCDSDVAPGAAVPTTARPAPAPSRIRIAL